MNLLQPNYSLMLGTLAVFLAPLVVVGWLALRFLRRTRESRAHPEMLLAERERLVTLAERIEAVAEDVGRLEESQYFTAALMAEGGAVKPRTGRPPV